MCIRDRNCVAAGLADRMEIQLAYAIGVAHPVSVRVDTFGTNHIPEDKICLLYTSPLTFRTMSGREVLTDLWQESEQYKVQHIGVAEEIDLLVIAPATANFIAKMAHGIADDLLSTVVPVSYTHLDVYKRQVLCSGKFQFRNGGHKRAEQEPEDHR